MVWLMESDFFNFLKTEGKRLHDRHDIGNAEKRIKEVRI